MQTIYAIIWGNFQVSYMARSPLWGINEKQPWKFVMCPPNSPRKVVIHMA